MRYVDESTFNKTKTVMNVALFAGIVISSVSLATATVFTAKIFFLIAVTTLASILSCTAGSALPIIAAIFGWAGASVMSGSALTASVTLISVPYSFTFSLLRKKKLNRADAVGVSAATVTAVSVLLLLLNAYVCTGEISLNAINYTYSPHLLEVGYLLRSAFSVQILGEEIPLIANSNIYDYLKLYVALIPGIIALISSFLGFVTFWIARKFTDGILGRDSDNLSWKLLCSPVTIITFIAVCILYSLVEEGNIFCVAALNLILMLIPTVLITGFSSAFEPIVSNGIKRPRILRPFLLIISLLTSASYFYYCCITFASLDGLKTIFKGKFKKNQE